MTAQADMRGKRVVLTGGTSGIGQATAVALAEAGAELTLVCRSAERGEHFLRKAVPPLRTRQNQTLNRTMH